MMPTTISRRVMFGASSASPAATIQGAAGRAVRSRTRRAYVAQDSRGGGCAGVQSPPGLWSRPRTAVNFVGAGRRDLHGFGSWVGEDHGDCCIQPSRVILTTDLPARGGSRALWWRLRRVQSAPEEPLRRVAHTG